MTENDKSLIAEAQRMMRTFNWSAISELEEKAETKTAKKVLHQMAVRMYHNEEASCGII